MKRLFLIVFIFATIFSCSGPRGPKVISTENMEKIITEMFLVNAMVDVQSLKDIDTIDIYEPIFAKYGHTATDMLYTVTDMSTRKSVRLSDVINSIIANLDAEYNRLNRFTINVDTMERRIVRLFRNTVYERDSIIVSSLKDTASLCFKIPVSQGVYDVDYTFTIDTLYKDRSISYKYGFIDTLGRYKQVISRYLSERGKRKNEKVSITVDKDLYDTLVFRLGVYGDKGTNIPNMRIDTVRVYHSLPLEAAKDSFMMRLMDIESLFDKYYVNREKDSSSLPLGPTGFEAWSNGMPQ